MLCVQDNWCSVKRPCGQKNHTNQEANTYTCLFITNCMFYKYDVFEHC